MFLQNKWYSRLLTIYSSLETLHFVVVVVVVFCWMIDTSLFLADSVQIKLFSTSWSIAARSHEEPSAKKQWQADVPHQETCFGVNQTIPTGV